MTGAAEHVTKRVTRINGDSWLECTCGQRFIFVDVAVKHVEGAKLVAELDNAARVLREKQEILELASELAHQAALAERDRLEAWLRKRSENRARTDAARSALWNAADGLSEMDRTRQ